MFIEISRCKKIKTSLFLNHPELTRLIVDSGEIKAKLELFCLNETTELKPVSDKIPAKSKSD